MPHIFFVWYCLSLEEPFWTLLFFVCTLFASTFRWFLLLLLLTRVAAIEQFTSLTILFISSIFVAFFRRWLWLSSMLMIDFIEVNSNFVSLQTRDQFLQSKINNYQCLSWAHAMHDWRTVELNGNKGSIIWMKRRVGGKSIQWQTSAMECCLLVQFRILLSQEICSCRCFQF